MDDIKFIIDFAQRGQLNKIIKDLEKTNSLMEKNISLQSEQGKAVHRTSIEYETYTKKVDDAQKKVQQSADAKQFVALTAEISKLRGEYDKLSTTVKKKQQTDKLSLEQQVRLNAETNKRKAAIREQIKDEQALTYTINTQTKSIADLQAKNNALIRQRKQLDLSTESGKKQYNELTKAIRKNNDELKKHDAAIGSHVRNVGNYGSALQGLGRNFLMLAGFTGAIAVIRNAMQTVTEFDQSLAELQSITGLTDEAVAGLGDKAIEMSMKFGTSAVDITKGMALIGSKKPELLGNAEALAEVTAQADILSKAAGISLPEAADALTKSMNQYGESANEAAKYTDILATSQQKGTATIASISEALKNVGSVAKTTGLSFETTNAVLQAMAKGGLEGAEAGTKLRTILLRLAKTGRDDLNPAVTDINDILNTLAKEIPDVTSAQKMFGEEAAAAALTLINQRDVVKDLNGALYEQGNALKQAENNTDTLSGKTAKLGAAWDAFILSLEDGDGVIAKVLGGLVDFLTTVLDAMSKLGKSADELYLSAASQKFGQIYQQKTSMIIQLSQKSVEELTKIATNGTKEEIKWANTLISLKKQGYSDEEAAIRTLAVIREYENKKAFEESKNVFGNDKVTGRARIQFSKKANDELLSILSQFSDEKLKILTQSNDAIVRAEAEAEILRRKKAFESHEQDKKDIKNREQEKRDLLREEMDKTLKEDEEYLRKQREKTVEQVEIREANVTKTTDRALKERRLKLEYEGKTEKEIEDDLAEYKIRLLESEIESRRLYGQDTLDLELELYEEKRKLADKELREEQERQEKRKEFIQNTIQYTIDETRRAVEEQINESERALEAQQQNIDTQRKLAEQGLENTLAFEKQLAAQREAELIKNQKKEERLRKIETFYNLVSSYSKEDPSTAAAKALVQMGIAEAIAATFRDGGIVSDEVAKQNGGVLRGPSHERGGILIEAEGEEGIFSKKEMRRLGKDRFYAIKEALNTPQGLEAIKTANDQVAMTMVPVREKIDLSPLERKLEAVQNAIESKPVPSFVMDRNGNLITRLQARGVNQYKVQQGKGFNG